MDQFGQWKIRPSCLPSPKRSLVYHQPSGPTFLLDCCFSPRTGPTAGPFLGRCSTRKYVGSTSSKVLFVLPWPEGWRRNTYLALKPRTLRTPTLPQLRLLFIDLRYKLINCIHARSIHTTSTIEDPLGVLRNIICLMPFIAPVGLGNIHTAESQFLGQIQIRPLRTVCVTNLSQVI